jgi:hypothetical protein
MKLHRNAALSWQGRRRLVVRVVEPGVDADGGGGRGRRRQPALCASGGWAAPGGGRGRAQRPFLGTCVGREPAACGQGRGAVRLRKLRLFAVEIAGTLGMALSTISGMLTRLELGRLSRIGLEQPDATSAPAHASSSM